ncbi:glycosyltransferase family protein [Nocardioides sp. NBC_00163]|uniref:glycosyltransferase n=1 Tax=Nocardioides sp. NBC_00163 TaxID=2975999 RepID=UPI003252DD6A
MGEVRTPVSIVCVYNNPAVLESCLATSVKAGPGASPQTEVIPVDNVSNAFASAGAALNHGARMARNEVVVFVHQDVYLHSLPALEAAAATLLADQAIGVLGAVGVDHRGEVIGAVRDRVVPLGRSTSVPVDVDSLDEVLFMVTRSQVLREPLSESPDLAWHAYAVEYCLRMRASGRRAAAVDVPLTHNSMTTNLARLDVAHRSVGRTYASLMPVRTTCGIVAGEHGAGTTSWPVRRARGARTFWGESARARRVTRSLRGVPQDRDHARGRARQVVLADIRLLVDDVARLAGSSSIRVIDPSRDGTVGEAEGLERNGLAFSAATLRWPGVVAAVAATTPDRLLLVSGLRPEEIAPLAATATGPYVVGLARDTGLWLLLGPDPAALAPLWSRPRNRPFFVG